MIPVPHILHQPPKSRDRSAAAPVIARRHLAAGERQGLIQSLLSKAVFALDRHLQKSHGVFCYTSDPGCIFRISLKTLKAPVMLDNGVNLPAGSQIAELHLWNEQVPILGKAVTPVAWGLQWSRGFARSLRLLSAYLAEASGCGSVCAVRADLALGTAGQTAQLLRICRSYGFVTCSDGINPPVNTAHKLGENILIAMIVIALDIRAFRFSLMRRDRVRLFLTRDELNRRFGPDESAQVSPRRLGS